MFKRMMGYVKDTKFLGKVLVVDLVNSAVMLHSDYERITVKLDDVEILQEAFEIHDTIIYDKDVLGAINGQMYLVELHSNGDVTLHNIDDKFEVTRKNGGYYRLTDNILEDFENTFNLVGNVYQLRNNLPKEPDFDVKIVKEFNGIHFEYFYALNNKKEKQIDLVKVTFFGDTLIKGEEHERKTISYDSYMKSISGQILKEVSVQELKNYVTGKNYNGEDKDTTFKVCGVNCGCTYFCENERASEPDTSVGEDVPEETKKCEKCNSELDDCYCAIWD